MKNILFTLTFLFSTYIHAETLPLRVAVIGGITMSGLWEQISDAFEKKHGIKTQLVVTGNKAVLNEYCQKNPVDLVTMHSSDTISNLASAGVIEGLTPWIHNAQMIISEKTNPAQLNHNDTLEIALKKISDSNNTFILHLSAGTFEVFHALNKKYAFKPKIIVTQRMNGFFKDVVTHKGYTLFGVIPYLMKKHSNPHLTGFVIDDEALRRPYLAAIGTTERIGEERHKNAELLLKFLVSPEVQNLIRDFRLHDFPETRVFFPMKMFN